MFGSYNIFVFEKLFYWMNASVYVIKVIGAGYIAVELAGILNALGSDTSLFTRYGHALRTFDESISRYGAACCQLKTSH